MNEFLKLYRASPDAFFSALDKRFLEAESQLSSCLISLESIAALADEFLKMRAPMVLAPPKTTSWIYLADLPNIYFEDVFEPEKSGANTKRWVGRSGRIALKLGVSRALQYNFLIEVEGFASPNMAKTFTLTADGKFYPWLEIVGNKHSTIILETSNADFLELELTVDTSALPSDKDVTFAFSKIALEPRGSLQP